jgi:hypothetical protein
MVPAIDKIKGAKKEAQELMHKKEQLQKEGKNET